jgi:hypothetical protein
MIRKLLLLILLALPAAAQAEWYEATSNNFIVYSDGSRSDAEAYAAKLERYHYVLRTFHRITDARMPNRLRVFLFSNAGEVGDFYGGASVAGVYIPDARAMMFVGTRSRASGGDGDPRSAQAGARLDPEAVLLHEYAHHFMFHYFPATYPTWYVEGFAEFWGSTRFLDNDVVEVGHPAEHRFQTFQYLSWLPLERLLTAHNYGEVRGENIFSLYAQGWLLMRYVFENPERKRQLDRYLQLINEGATYEAATREAFTDLGAFNSALYNYAGRSRFNVIQLPFRTIDVGPITVRELRPAENALIEHEMRLSRGYAHTEAAEFASDVRSVAARYPDDPFALSVLMEAERLAGNHAAAVAAADRLLAIQPGHARAMATRGLAQAALLRAANSTDTAAWAAIQQMLARAARAAPADPVVLAAYYDSYALQGVLPPAEAQNALYTAMEQAPVDDELRYRLARDFEQRRMIPEAIAIIRFVALMEPHREDETARERRRREQDEERYRRAGRERHESPREMLARLEGNRSELDRQRQVEAEEDAAND